MDSPMRRLKGPPRPSYYSRVSIYLEKEEGCGLYLGPGPSSKKSIPYYGPLGGRNTGARRYGRTQTYEI